MKICINRLVIASAIPFILMSNPAQADRRLSNEQTYDLYTHLGGGRKNSHFDADYSADFVTIRLGCDARKGSGPRPMVERNSVKFQYYLNRKGYVVADWSYNKLEPTYPPDKPHLAAYRLDLTLIRDKGAKDYRKNLSVTFNCIKP